MEIEAGPGAPGRDRQGAEAVATQGHVALGYGNVLYLELWGNGGLHLSKFIEPLKQLHH